MEFGGDNVLAVRADTSAQPASRWYAGAGIYRHVRLVFTDPIHIAEHGVFIHTPEVSSTQALVAVETSVVNALESPRVIAVRTTLLLPDGIILGTNTSLQTVPPGKVEPYRQQIRLPDPKLWDLDSPKQYIALSEVFDGTNCLDQQLTRFGIRDATF